MPARDATAGVGVRCGELGADRDFKRHFPGPSGAHPPKPLSAPAYGHTSPGLCHPRPAWGGRPLRSAPAPGQWRWEVMRCPQGAQGFVLLPKCWGVEWHLCLARPLSATQQGL